MTLIEKGRVVIITKGADTGKEAVIKEPIDDNFVKIVGEKVKERRINIKHFEITNRKTDKMPVPKIKEKKAKPTKEGKQERQVKKKAKGNKKA